MCTWGHLLFCWLLEVNELLLGEDEVRGWSSAADAAVLVLSGEESVDCIACAMCIEIGVYRGIACSRVCPFIIFRDVYGILLVLLPKIYTFT